MNNYFFDNIIGLLEGSDIKLFNTEIRKVCFDNEEKNVTLILNDRLKYCPTKLFKIPAISCLNVFTLFDVFLEKKYNLQPGSSFKSRYNSLKENTNQDIIEKECYRLMIFIRNGFVHNIDNIIVDDNKLKFNYKYKLKQKNSQENIFNLDISYDKLNLLYSIIILLVKGNYVINTKGHFEGIISTYYKELKDYIDNHGNFKDNNEYKLKDISLSTKLKTMLRYYVEYNVSNYKVEDNRIVICNRYNPQYDDYSSDYCINYKEKSYIIPNEVLDENNSISIEKLESWEHI